MSKTNEPVSQVISVENDEEEDVEVVFTNLSKSLVYRNLIQQKIFQEIELLQALSKTQTIPNEFNEFKDQAKKLGFHYGDDVIRSAWQRVMKKYLSKLATFPSNTAPVCQVKPLVPFSIISTTQANVVSSLHHSTTTGSSSSASVTPAAVPVALLLNTSFHIQNSPQRSTDRPLKLLGTIELDTDDDENCVTATTDNTRADKTLDPAQECGYSEISAESANKNDNSTNKQNSKERKSHSVDKTLDPAQECGYSEISAEPANKNDNSTNKKNSKKRKSKTNDFSFNSDKQGLSINSAEELGVVQNSVVRSVCDSYFDSLASEQNQPSEKQVAQKSSEKYKTSNIQTVPKSSPQVLQTTRKHSLSSTESNQIESKRNTNASFNEKCLKKRTSSSLDKQCLISKRPRLSHDPQNIVENCVHSVLSEKHNSCGLSKELQKTTQKCNSLCKKVVSEESSKTVVRSIAKSHVGVRAKIVRTKQSIPSNTRKRLSKPLKEMSQAELKEFRAEQKRLKWEEKRQFELQQLQKVHDRLVDVLIPKYYNKNHNGGN